MTRRTLLAQLASLPFLRGQETRFEVDVQLVSLLATVKDEAGELVGALERDDFTVYDNGVVQQIAVFERRTSQPLSVALLVDVSGSIAVRLPREVGSVLRFADALFREGNPLDALSLYSFNQDVTLETSFTRRVKRLEKELKSLKAEAGTSLYDAIYFASRTLGYRRGRRVIVIVSDGADTTSVKSFREALEAAHDADAVLYGIMIQPVTSDAGRHVAGENAFTSLCAGTGGRVLSALPGEDFDASFDSILRDLRTQYLIGYYPRNVPFSTDPFHRIEIHLRRPGLRAITRTGYYGVYEEPESPPASPSGPSRKSRQQE